jgi:hypothetical protein
LNPGVWNPAVDISEGKESILARSTDEDFGQKPLGPGLPFQRRPHSLALPIRLHEIPADAPGLP